MNSESGRRSASHPEAIHTWTSCRPQLWNRAFEVDRTVFQLDSSGERHITDRVSPLPAMSVCLSLPFHNCAHKIYWCLCSWTAGDSSVPLWGPFPRC